MPPWLTITPPVASEWGACLQTLEGHTRFVGSVAFSHDSKTVASASGDQTIKIWDVVTGVCISTLEGHDSTIKSATFSHDSKILASTSYNDVRLWDTVTGTCTSILKGDYEYIRSTAFSHDCRMLASASVDCTIKLWDVTSGTCTLTLTGHNREVWLVAFSDTSKTLVSVSGDSCIKRWDAVTGDCKTTITVNDDDFISAALSYGTTILALVSQQDNSCIRLWNTADGECMATLKGHSKPVHTLSFSRDSKKLASACDEGIIKIWDVATSTSVATLQDPGGLGSSIHFSHDSKLLVTSSNGGKVKIWDLEIDMDPIPLSPLSEGIIYGIKPIEGTKTLISRSPNDIIQLWDGPPVCLTATFTGSVTWLYSVAIAHNAKILATTSVANGQIQLWNIATGANIATIEGHDDSMISAAPEQIDDSTPPMMEDGDYRSIKVWQPKGEFYRQYEADFSIVSAITFSHDSQLLASASAADGAIKVWNIDSNACIATLIGHSSWVSQLEFLPQSDVLVSSSGDRTVKIWDICTATCTATLEGQSEPHYKTIAFSHDYNMLASGTDDGNIDIWNISAGERQIKLLDSDQVRTVRTVAFSRSSALLASINKRPQGKAHSYGAALKFWSVSTGQCLATVDIGLLAWDYSSFDDVAPCLSTSVGQFVLKRTFYSRFIYGQY